MPPKITEPENDFPAGMGQPALRALAAARYTRLEQFAGVRAADLLILHGVRPKAIRVLRSALADGGLKFADIE